MRGSPMNTIATTNSTTNSVRMRSSTRKLGRPMKESYLLQQPLVSDTQSTDAWEPHRTASNSSGSATKCAKN